MKKNPFLISVLISAFLTLAVLPKTWADVTVEGDLPRRADLGFGVSENGDSLAVAELNENSPAAQAGLLKGDVIAGINGQAYGQGFEGQDLLRRLDGGQVVTLNILRAGGGIDISFTPSAFPFDDPDGVATFYNGFKTSDGSHLRTVLSHRDGLSGPLPVVMLIQWVSCGIVTDDMETELKTVMDALPVAIFRVERSSDGDSEGPACHALDYNTEILHYTEALLDIAGNPDVDAPKIYLYGSSLGSTVAPLVAQKLKQEGLQVAGLMVQGGGAVTYVERMINFDRINLERRDGRDFTTIQEEMSDKILFQTEYLIKGRHPDDIAGDNPAMARVRDNILGLGTYEHYGRPFAWHQQAAKQDFLQAWIEVNAPSLIAFAEFDQFEGRHGHKMIVEVLNRVNPGIAEYIELPNINHFNDFHTDIDQAYFRADGIAAIDLLAAEMVKWLSKNLD